jgi:Domain of unknown function (DUF4439)
MTALGALQDCLAAEHAALYAYGVLGGVLSAAGRPADLALAQKSYVAHRTRRDDLTEVIAGLAATPSPADPVYATPFGIVDAADCRRLARLVERRTTEIYCLAVSQTTGPVRRMLASGVTDAAVREVGWGGAVEAFPGAPEL